MNIEARHGHEKHGVTGVYTDQIHGMEDIPSCTYIRW